MRERIESKHVTKEIKSQMPVIPVAIVKERGCTFCPYYLGNYEKQPRCMMKTCAWDDERVGHGGGSRHRCMGLSGFRISRGILCSPGFCHRDRPDDTIHIR